LRYRENPRLRHEAKGQKNLVPQIVLRLKGALRPKVRVQHLPDFIARIIWQS
jgi:hypothetical protein